ncbi:alpha-amylase family glycosyl hydrolase [Clostridium sp. C2-6-12]|uniref:alpha-amylase family glycosyl hydrolase n=1 Tax=Clostridium sp. C2-6-12 TaxID=2698832 RepID=UPI0013701F52|nr:alpha-amylase family glycosyl hydrolase [Clostridium sp. C2-6-12]
MRRMRKVLASLVVMVIAIGIFSGCKAKEYKNNADTNMPFSWDNATVYFALTDRFLDGDESNNHSYGRELDENGNENSDYKNQPATFHGGDIVGITKKINEGYFNDLGVNAIWITSPFEQIHGYIGGDKFRHYAYHGYYNLDYTSIDANVGTKEQFSEFVDTAHKHGIRVVLDVVLNHPGYVSLKDMDEYGFGKLKDDWKNYYYGDSMYAMSKEDQKYMDITDKEAWSKWWGSQWVRASQKYSGYDGSTSGSDKTICLSGLPDFKTETTYDPGIPEIWKTKWTKEGRYEEEKNSLKKYFEENDKNPTVANYLIKEISDWVRLYGIDGFRCDTAKHVEEDKWKDLKEQCSKALKEWKNANPDKKLDDSDFWMTGEVWGQQVGRTSYYDNGFDSLINFGFQMDAANLKSINSTYESYAKKLSAGKKFNILSYISSHDTTLYNRDDLINGGTALLLVPGGVQIYYGDETARPIKYEDCSYKDQQTRGDMNWESINKEVLKHWQILGRFRRAHLAIGAGEHKIINDSPYIFSRVYKNDEINDKVICVIGAEEEINIDVSSIFEDGEIVRDAYTGNTTKVKNGKVVFKPHKNGVILIEEMK